MMRLDPGTRFLIGKNYQQVIEPAEIFLQALTSAVFFGIMFYCVCFELRYQNVGVCVLIALLLLFAVLGVTFGAIACYRMHRPCRKLFVAATVMWGGIIAGYVLGDRFWYSHTVRYFSYGEMASYVNIDPDKDKGQSYMDAGTIYFKENSHVDTTKVVAFHNGQTYCVAPIIMNHRFGNDQNATLQMVNGFSPPASGTVDFWAVGINCCGEKGDSFTCSDAGSRMARSGARLLDDTARSMYLLAVQEWSATTGLPVRHPLFLHWVVDPIAHAEHLHVGAYSSLFYHAALVFAVALFVAAGMSVSMKQLRIQ